MALFSSAFYILLVACCTSFVPLGKSQTLHFDVAQIQEIKSFVGRKLPEFCGEMPPDMVLVTSHSVLSEKYADFQIKKVRSDPCVAFRFITIANDAASLESCLKREFGLCVQSAFYEETQDIYDHLFNPWAMVADLLNSQINVFYSEYNVLILKNPMDSYEPKIDFIYQKAKYNDTTIVMGNSLWTSNQKNVQLTRQVFAQKSRARVEEQHVNMYFAETIKNMMSEMDLMPATFSFMHLSACWDLNVATTTYQVKNGHSYHLDCLRDNEALEIAEVVTL